MQYILTGQIFEAIQKNYTDKKTGEITKKFVELTVEQLFRDQDGNRIKDVDVVQMPDKDFHKFKSNLDAYISIPFSYITYRGKDGQNGSMMVKTEGLDYIITKENPYKVPADQQKK